MSAPEKGTATAAAPWLPQGRSLPQVTLAQMMALALPFLAALVERGAGVLSVLGVSLAASLGWELVFAAIRKRPFTVHGVTTALIVTVMLPGDTVLWQLALAVSTGVVLGELVFGGRGFGFLAPAAVCLALLRFSFPGTPLAAMSQWVALATLPGAALLITGRMVSWRMILGALGSFIAFTAFISTPPHLAATATALAFGLVFLVCDPAGAAVSHGGRWLQGALAGFLVAFFSIGAPHIIAPAALVSAALLASLFAPLLDHFATLETARWRGSGHHG